MFPRFFRNLFLVFFESQLFVVELIVACVTHSKSIIGPIVVLTVIGFFLLASYSVTAFAHAFGVVSLIVVFAFCNLSFFVLSSLNCFGLGLRFLWHIFLLVVHGSPLEVVEYRTFIYFKIELWFYFHLVLVFMRNLIFDAVVAFSKFHQLKSNFISFLSKNYKIFKIIRHY